MKYRIKIVQTATVSILEIEAEKVTYSLLNTELKKFIRSTLEVDVSIEDIPFQISLNGKNPLPPVSNPDDTELSELGIVMGDTIFIIHIPDEMIPRLESSNTCLADTANLNASIGKEVPAERTEPLAMITDSIGLREPICICDSSGSQIPRHLSCTLDDLKDDIKSPNDVMIILLHFLMLEMGFTIQDTDKTDCVQQNLLSVVFKQWKASKICKITYEVPDDDINDPVILVCVPLGKLLMVHGTCSWMPLSLYIRIDPSQYVACPSEIISTKYELNNLTQLSIQFKNSVAYPLLISALQAHNKVMKNSLLGMPFELKLKILYYLDFLSVVRIGMTCSVMRDVSNEPEVWKRLYMRDLAVPLKWTIPNEPIDFKEKYIAHRRRIYSITSVRPSSRSRAFIPYGDTRQPRPLPVIFPYLGGEYNPLPGGMRRLPPAGYFHFPTRHF